MKNLFIAAFVALALVLGSCSQNDNPTTTNSTVAGSQLPTSNSHKPTQYDYPLNFWVYNSCCGEWVHITGEAHYQVFYDGTTYRFHYNTSQLTGDGASGDTYHGTISEHETYNNTNGATELTLSDRWTLTSSS